MEENNTKLTVKLNERDVVIDVIDIVYSDEYNKEYIIYTIEGTDEEQVFVSILNESDTTFSLDTIEDENEFNHVNELILNSSLDFEDNESGQD